MRLLYFRLFAMQYVWLKNVNEIIKFLLQIKNYGKILEMQLSLDPKYVPIVSLSSSVLEEGN